MTGSSPGNETGYLADLLKETPAEDVKPEAAAPSAAEGEKPAPSPSADAEAGKPAEGEKAEPKSLLDAVQAAVKPDKALEQSPGSKTETEKQEAAKAAEKDGKAVHEPPPDHPRFKEVIAERNALKPKAEAFDQFVGAVAEAGLSVQEYNQLLGVGALIKHDPAKALAEIEKVADQLRALVGEKLPPALQQRVDDGEISEADARELSRARARADMTEQRSQQTEQERVTERRRVHLAACDEAANRWTEQQRAADPDWSKKEQLVREQAELLLHQYGPPPTVDDALKLMRVAKNRAEERLRAVLPAKSKIEAPVRAGAASATHAPAPKSIEEAVALGLKMTAAAA